MREFYKKRNGAYYSERIGVMWPFYCENDNVSWLGGLTWMYDNNFSLCRTWEDVLKFFKWRNEELEENHKEIYFMFDLQEFWFRFKKWTEGMETDVFGDDGDEIIITIGKVELRSLDKLEGKDLEDTLNMCQLKGFKEFNHIIGPTTPLTTGDLKLIENNLNLLKKVIELELIDHKHIYKIPVTMVKKVRDKLKNKLNRNENYREKNKNNVIKNAKEYQLLLDNYSAPFCHIRSVNTGELVEDVWGYDICSMYPAILTLEKFPYGKAKFSSKKSEKYVLENISSKLMMFRAAIYDVKIKPKMPLFLDDIWCPEKTPEGKKNRHFYDNGKVIYADFMLVPFTNITYELFNKYYDKEKVVIYDFYEYDSDYLPFPMVKTILDLFKEKCRLKDQSKKLKGDKKIANELKLNRVKVLLNNISGSIGMQPHKYAGDLELDEVISNYNKDYLKRIGYLPWAVFMIDYGKQRIYHLIDKDYENHRYGDTDSAYFKGNHDDIIEQDNKEYLERMEQRLYNYWFDTMYAKDCYGYRLGAWEGEQYQYGKFLKKKTYLLQKKDGSLDLTSSGLVVKKALKTIKNINMFKFGLKIPEKNTGRYTYVMHRNEYKGMITDWRGEQQQIVEKQYITKSGQSFLIGSPTLCPLLQLMGFIEKEIN